MSQSPSAPHGETLPELRGYPPSLTVKDVSEILSMQPSHVRAMLTRQDIPSFRVGKEWRVRRHTLQLVMRGDDPWDGRPKPGPSPTVPDPAASPTRASGTRGRVTGEKSNATIPAQATNRSSTSKTTASGPASGRAHKTRTNGSTTARTRKAAKGDDTAT